MAPAGTVTVSADVHQELQDGVSNQGRKEKKELRQGLGTPSSFPLSLHEPLLSSQSPSLQGVLQLPGEWRSQPLLLRELSRVSLASSPSAPASGLSLQAS